MAYRPPWAQKRESGAASIKPTKQSVNEPKSVFAPNFKNELAFPTLGELQPKKKERLDFVSAANRVEYTPIKVANNENNTIHPEWTSMQIKNGKIIDNSLPITMNQDIYIADEDVERMINEMVNRWQAERDSLNNLYGDMSPYWDSLPIGEEIDDD